jgi:hypothetical protein
MAEWTDDFGNKLVGVHEQWQCMRNYCTIHKPSDHSMRRYKQLWRNDTKVMERVCEHGVGHPDPDEINPDGMHGCDGCCLQVLEVDIPEPDINGVELVMKIFKNDGGYTERQRTLAILAEMAKDTKSKVARGVIGEAIERIIATPVGE